MKEILLYSALSVVIYMNLLFMIAQLSKDNSIADIGWGAGFIMITFVSLWKVGSVTLESGLVAALIILWGIRLSAYIFSRNRIKGEDYRYKKWREEWGKNAVWRAYVQVFMLQGLIMWLAALPVMLIIGSSTNQIGVMEITGVVIWLIGFVCEAVSDYQMRVFKRNPENKGRIMKYGLWRYSRHPNYFGESALWWGIFIISVNNGFAIFSVMSPLLLTFLLLRVSGVTLLEKKYVSNPEYQKYIRNTSAFIPLPVKN